MLSRKKFILGKSISKTNLINMFKRCYDGFKDQDRIFTNLYWDGNSFIDGALKIGDLHSRKKHMPFRSCHFLLSFHFRKFLRGIKTGTQEKEWKRWISLKLSLTWMMVRFFSLHYFSFKLLLILIQRVNSLII